MKRVYVNEEWCLGCHLCEYNCAFANSGETDMVKALKGKPIFPRIRVEGENLIHFAVSCRHCQDPICVNSCISGALSVKDGRVCIDRTRCVGQTDNSEDVQTAGGLDNLDEGVFRTS